MGMTTAEIDDIFGEFDIDEDYMVKTKEVLGLFVAQKEEEKKEATPPPVEEAPLQRRTRASPRRRRRRRPPSKCCYDHPYYSQTKACELRTSAMVPYVAILSPGNFIKSKINICLQ